jgi:hypothetical protein
MCMCVSHVHFKREKEGSYMKVVTCGLSNHFIVYEPPLMNSKTTPNRKGMSAQGSICVLAGVQV